MGTGGVLSRLLFPALGSLFTFAAFGVGTAPGQLSLEETVSCFRKYYPPTAAT
jgi:3-dehydroquinate dehydratase